METHKEALVNGKENELKAASTRFPNLGNEVTKGRFSEENKIIHMLWIMGRGPHMLISDGRGGGGVRSCVENIFLI